MGKDPRTKRYSEVFKRQVVRDLESGKTTEAEVRRRYGVSGGMTIRSWLKKYGGGGSAPRQRTKRKGTLESRKMLLLERRNDELKRAVSMLTIEKVALESLIEEAQTHLAIDLKKTFGTGR